MNSLGGDAPVAVEELRDAGIERYDVLGHPTPRDLQALVELAAAVCDVPSAAINVITSAHQHQVAAVGFEPAVCSRADSMCAVVLDEPAVVTIPDAQADPRLRENPFVDGTLGRVRFYASTPLSAPDGLTIGRLCVFDVEPRTLTLEQESALAVLGARIMDVLELKLRTAQLEASLRELTQARDELRRSNDQLAGFAGQVSHDLRNPLTGLLAHVEMLSDHPMATDEDAAWMVEGAMRSGRRMVTLIEDLLAFARVGGALKFTEVDLGDVLEAAREDLAVLLRESGATVQAKDLPVVTGDWAQLYAMLQNLLSNAAKFRRSDVPPQIVVSGRRHGDMWRIEVADNGVGVPEARREELFALLARGSKQVEGSGIGLATCRRIVQAHGGRIGLEDSPLGGALVWFELPA